MVLIFVFGYFYTLLELNPDEMAENLDKNRSYIPGITPGDATSNHLKYVITRITVFGTLGLMVMLYQFYLVKYQTFHLVLLLEVQVY